MRTGIRLCALVAFLPLSGCGGAGETAADAGGQPNTATVNLTVSDTPSSGLTVLSFQVQITAAVLQPGSVSLLPRPVTVDLAQLVSDTGFLASTVIESGTYSSLAITLADPQVTVLNNTGAALTLPNGTCAVGSICTFAPALDTATVTISSGVLPLTVTASSSTGLNLDLSIPGLLQSDLSIELANGSSVNLSLLTGADSSAIGAQIDDVLGTVTGIDGNLVNLTTSLGSALVLTASDTSSYDYPTSVCSAGALSCVSVGQVVTAELSVQTSGALQINSLAYVGPSGSRWVKALVVGPVTAGATPSLPVLLQGEINAGAATVGTISTLSLAPTAIFGVASEASPSVPSATFAGTDDLMLGQELLVSLEDGVTTGSSVSISSGSLYLEPSQLIGAVGGVDSGGDSFELVGLSGLFDSQRPVIQDVDVQAGSGTQYIGLAGGSVGALSVGQLIAVKGPLFNTTASVGSPSVAALQVRARATGD